MIPVVKRLVSEGNLGLSIRQVTPVTEPLQGVGFDLIDSEGQEYGRFTLLSGDAGWFSVTDPRSRKFEITREVAKSFAEELRFPGSSITLEVEQGLDR